MHYNTRIFDSITGFNSFNLSVAGATPKVAFGALKAYLHNSKAPEYLFYELDAHYLRYESATIKEFNNFFPFFSNPVLLQQFNSIDPRMKHFHWNPYYSFPFTGMKNLSTSLHGWLQLPNKTDDLYYKGYLKEVLRPSLKFVDQKPYYSYFQVTERAYLDSIITLCKANKTRLTLITSPLFAGGKVDLVNKKDVVKQLQNIAVVNKINYLDFSSLSFCSSRNLFIDHYHMNYAGATKFTLYFSSIFNNKLLTNALK